MPPPAATIAPARRVRGRLRVPATSRSRIATRCSPRSPTGASTLDQLRARRRLPVDAGLPARRSGVDDRRRRRRHRHSTGTRFRADSVRPPAPLDAGNSGTTMRMLAGVLAGQPFSATHDRRRVAVAPADAPRHRAARAHGRPHRGDRRPRAADDPRRARCTPLHYAPDVAERPGQERRAARRPARRRARPRSPSRPQTRDHTERALAAFGGAVDVDGLTVSVAGGQRLHGADARRARRLLVGGVLAGRRRGAARLARRDRGRRPEPDADGAARRAAALRRARRRSRSTATRRRRAARHDHRRRRSRPARVDIAPEEVPGLIDELPAIAALAAHGGEVTVRGAGELRVKESDRIAALVAGFRAPRHRRRRAAGRLRRRGRPGRRPPGGARRRARRSPDGDGVRHRRARRRAARRRIDGADAVGDLLSRASSRRSAAGSSA